MQCLKGSSSSWNAVSIPLPLLPMILSCPILFKSQFCLHMGHVEKTHLWLETVKLILADGPVAAIALCIIYLPI